MGKKIILKTVKCTEKEMAIEVLKEMLWKINAYITIIPEYKFHPKRKWRFDYAIIDFKIAVEIEGGSWIQGRHTRGLGFNKDMEKYNEAVKLGWRVLRYPTLDIDKIFNDIKELLNYESI